MKLHINGSKLLFSKDIQSFLSVSAAMHINCNSARLCFNIEDLVFRCKMEY